MIKYVELNVNNQTIRGLHNNSLGKELCVMLHGFTGHKNENGFLFKNLSNHLATQNIDTIRFDYRGSGDSDRDFKDQTFFTCLEDARAIVDYAYELNHNKPIILLGFSMGGAIAGRLSVEKSEKIKLLVLLSPAGNLPTLLLEKFKAFDYPNYLDLGGYLIGKPYYETLIDYDMYKDCESFTKPVLITQGVKDIAVYPFASKKYTKYFPNYEYVLISDASHCYTTIKQRRELYEVVSEFLEKNLNK